MLWVVLDDDFEVRTLPSLRWAGTCLMASCGLLKLTVNSWPSTLHHTPTCTSIFVMLCITLILS